MGCGGSKKEEDISECLDNLDHLLHQRHMLRETKKEHKGAHVVHQGTGKASRKITQIDPVLAKRQSFLNAINQTGVVLSKSGVVVSPKSMRYGHSRYGKSIVAEDTKDSESFPSDDDVEKKPSALSKKKKKRKKSRANTLSVMESWRSLILRRSCVDT